MTPEQFDTIHELLFLLVIQSSIGTGAFISFIIADMFGWRQK